MNFETAFFDYGKTAIWGDMRHGIGKEYILFQITQDVFHELELNYHCTP